MHISSPDIVGSVLQARVNTGETKQRVKESESRIDKKLPTFINKQYWWAAYG